MAEGFYIGKAVLREGGNRIKSRPAARTAACEPFDREPEPATGSVFANGLDRIGLAGLLEPAGRSEQRRHHQTIDMDRRQSQRFEDDAARTPGFPARVGHEDASKARSLLEGRLDRGRPAFGRAVSIRSSAAATS